MKAYFKSAWKIVGGTILLSLTVVAVIIGGYRLLLNSKIQAQLAAIKSKGEPVTLEELNTWKRSSIHAGNSNVAAFSNAFQRLVATPLLDRTFTNASANHEIEQFLKKNEDLIEMLRTGATIEDPHLTIQVPTGINSPLPHIEPLRRAAVLLRHHSRATASAGNTRMAMESLLLSQRLAMTLRNEHQPVSKVAQLAMFAINVQSFEHLLSHCTLQTEELNTLQRSFEECLTETSVKNALIGERCLGIDLFRYSLEEQFAILGTEDERDKASFDFLDRLTATAFKVLGKRQEDQLYYIETMTRLAETAALPFPHRVNDFLYDEELIPEVSRKNYYVTSGMLIPSLCKVGIREARAVALVRCAIAAIHFERVRILHGKLPKSLDDSALNDPIDLSDPFTGLPLFFTNTQSGYIIYSVGADLQDDQGQKRNTDSETFDEAFVVER